MCKRAKFLITLLCSMLLVLPAYASIEFEQVGNQSVRVSGTQYAPNTMVSLQVFKGEVGPSVLETTPAQDYMKVILCSDQSVTNSEGEFSFTFNIGGSAPTAQEDETSATGWYSAYVSFEGTGEPLTDTLYFIDFEDFKKTVQQLNQVTTDTTVAHIVTTKSDVLGFENDAQNPVAIGGVSKLLFNHIKSSPIDENDRNAAIEIWKKCLFIQKVNEGKTDNIFSHPTLCRIDESVVAQWVTKPFVSDNLKKEMTVKMTGKSFEKESDYIAYLTDAFILASVRYPNGYENLVKVLESFYTQIGINASQATDAVSQQISGKSYDTLPLLAEAIKAISPQNDTLQEKEEDVYVSPGGGDGGGGAKKEPLDVELEGFTEPSEPENLPMQMFSDVDAVLWAKDSINYLAERGIINGKADGKFCPNDLLTREEFVKMVVEAFEISQSTETSFSDVQKDAWYYTYVNKAYAAGVIKGINENEFGAGRNISRQDMAVICLNVAKSIGINTQELSEDVFTDDAGIADYAKAAVYTLKSLDIINGMDDGTYNPQGFTTRAQAAVVLYRLLTV